MAVAMASSVLARSSTTGCSLSTSSCASPTASSRTPCTLFFSSSPVAFNRCTIAWAKRASGVAHGRSQQARIVVSCSVTKLAEVESVELTEDTSAFPVAPGIYAIYDKAGELQYVGLSRRISSSLVSHMRDVPELCGSVKFAVIDAPERAALTDAWKAWLEEHINNGGNVPSGNVSGNTTWTARKARQTKPEIRLTPGAHVKLNVPLEALIDRVVKESNVVAFIKGTRTSPQCGFSHRVLTILNEQGVDYEVLNVLDDHHNPGLREAIKQYSQWPTIPQLYVKGEFVGGADVLNEMVESGEIKELFKK